MLALAQQENRDIHLMTTAIPEENEPKRSDSSSSDIIIYIAHLMQAHKHTHNTNTHTNRHRLGRTVVSSTHCIMEKSSDGLVVAGATVGHGYGEDATATKQRVLNNP